MINQESNQPSNNEPRFFYGYIVVMAAFLIFVVSFGIHHSYGVFFKPLLNEFGWTRAIISGAFSLSMVTYAISTIVMGGLNERFGPRMVVTLCGFLLGLGYLLMSQVNATWQLYLLWVVLIGVGIGGLRVPLISTVARWFVKRRSMMTGIVIAGSGIGQLIAPLVFSRLIAAYDWRLSYVLTGITILVVILVSAQFLRRDPSMKGLLPHGEGENPNQQKYVKSEIEPFSLKEASLTVQFWIFFTMWACFGFIVFAIMVHIVPHAIDLGIPAITAANLLAAYGGMGIVGNLALGSLGDRIGNRWVYIIGFILMLVCLSWLMLSNKVWMLFLFAAVFGFAHGGMAPQGSPLLAKLFGLRYHGSILGVIGIGFRIGAGIGPFVTGYIFDLTGGYQVAFLVCVFAGVGGLLFAILLRPTKRLGGKF